MLKETNQYSLGNVSLVEDTNADTKAQSTSKTNEEFLFSQLSKTQSENMQHRLEIKGLQNEIERIVATTKQREQLLAKKITQLSTVDGSKRELTKTILEKENQITKINMELSQLNMQINAYSASALRKDQIIAKLRDDKTKNEVTIANTKKDVQALISELEKAEMLKANLEKAVEKSQIEISNSNQEINQLRINLSQVREINIRLETENKSISALLEKSEAELSQMKEAHNSLNDDYRKSSFKAALEQERLTSVNNQLEAQLKLSIVKTEALEKKLSVATKKNEILESERGQLINELNQKNYEFGDLQLQYNRLTSEYANYKEQMTAEVERQKRFIAQRESELNQIFQTAENDYKSAQTRISALQKQIGENEAAKAELAKASNDQAQQIYNLKKELDEKRTSYNKFTAFFENERAKTNKVLSQLIQEIKHSIALHPLKDYLQATETELARKELEVKKVPYDAPNRRTLERQLEQLFEQRNTTRDLIAATEKHLLAQDTKVHHLMSYIDSLQVPKKL